MNLFRDITSKQQVRFTVSIKTFRLFADKFQIAIQGHHGMTCIIYNLARFSIGSITWVNILHSTRNPYFRQVSFSFFRTNFI